MNSDDSFELNRWLSGQAGRLKKVQSIIDSGGDVQNTTSELEEIVRSYVETANRGDISKIVYGFEETVFVAQEMLATAYEKLNRFDDALVLHRYVADTVQALVRDRHRNKESLKDVREKDIEHLSKTASFLVRFSRQSALQGNIAAATQLLDEAARLFDAWHLNSKYPELKLMIDTQFDAIGRKK